MDKRIIKEIDNTIKYIWKYDIKKDYENNNLLMEDTVKNALYFHLRTRLGTLLDELNIKIFTEFNSDKFKGIGYRPDMVIVQIDPDMPNEFLGDCVKEYVCIIELKYKSDTYSAANEIYSDYEKIRHYISEMDLNCHRYYMAAIWECQPDSKKWLDENDWAKGKLTELNADYGSTGNMLFYVKEH